MFRLYIRLCSRHRVKYRTWNKKTIKLIVLYFIVFLSKSDNQPDDGYIFITETCSCLYIYIYWWLDLIVVRRFEYTSDPESYTSGSVATGRASLAGQVKGPASDQERQQN